MRLFRFFGAAAVACVLASPLPAASLWTADLPEHGWQLTDVGTFNAKLFPYVWHYDLGWLYAYEVEEDEDFWVYSYDKEAWMYGRADLWPWTYTEAGGWDPARLLVFVLAGQSNMEGKNVPTTSVPAEYQGIIPQTLFYKVATQSWEPLAIGVSENKGFGPEISFAHTIQPLVGEPIGIIKVSEGGTDFEVDWNPSTEGPNYKELLNTVAAAVNTRSLYFAGMLWMQGEADTNSTTPGGPQYQQHLYNLIANVRLAWGYPTLPFIAGRIHNGISQRPYFTEVRNAQESLRTGVVNADWFNTDDLSRLNNNTNIHYDTEGMLDLGQRFAEYLWPLMVNPETE